MSDAFWGTYIPNPFYPTSIIRFTVEGDTPQPVKLEIYRLSGENKELVRMLLDENRKPGAYIEPWDGRDDAGKPLKSGFGYRFRVISGNNIRSVDLYIPEK